MAYRLQIDIGKYVFMSDKEFFLKEDAEEAKGDAIDTIANLDSLGKMPFEVQVFERNRFGPGWSACK